MSQITTHVLDTSSGKPAQKVPVKLEQPNGSSGWEVLGEGWTDTDGRISNLLPAERRLSPGIYRLTFDTGAYFSNAGIRTFYPEVKIVFETTDENHYHVPLLLNPYGYSTYRGS